LQDTEPDIVVCTTVHVQVADVCSTGHA